MTPAPEELVFETERLWVRYTRLSDLEAAHAIYTDPDVMRFLGGADREVAQTRQYIETTLARKPRGYGMWALEDKATGRLLGHGGLKPLEEGSEIEVGYHFARDVWGQGLATEVATASLAYGREVLGLARIVAVARPANVASVRVLTKIGMRRVPGAFPAYGHPCAFFVYPQDAPVPEMWAGSVTG